MEPLPNEVANLAKIYSRRFDEHLSYRNDVWKILTTKFFSGYIGPRAIVLDLGCGYGQFINNIHCVKKYAMDLNPRAKDYLSPDVTFLQQDCSQHWDLPDGSLDVVFTSNFFEHLPTRRSLADTLQQAHRCLRNGGCLIALGPNVKFVGGAYWDFVDHQIMLTERSVQEALEAADFRTELSIARFLPYTMVNTRRYPTMFVSLYLMLPLAWRIMGKQFLVVARKNG